MKGLLLNPWTWLVMVVVLLSAVGGGYWWGSTAAANACKAKAGTAATKVESVEDRRDENVEAIATATANAVASALSLNRGSTDESVARIRTVVVPGACRAVDPAIVRELEDARAGVNSALGVGVRPGAAIADPASPDR